MFSSITEYEIIKTLKGWSGVEGGGREKRRRIKLRICVCIWITINKTFFNDKVIVDVGRGI